MTGVIQVQRSMDHPYLKFWCVVQWGFLCFKMYCNIIYLDHWDFGTPYSECLICCILGMALLSHRWWQASTVSTPRELFYLFLRVPFMASTESHIRIYHILFIGSESLMWAHIQREGNLTPFEGRNGWVSRYILNLLDTYLYFLQCSCTQTNLSIMY